MYGTSKTLTTKMTSYHLISDIPKADTLERTLPLPMDLTLKVLQLKHTKYMYAFKIKKKVIIQWTYSILTLEVLIMSRTRLSWYTVQPPDKRHLATCKLWYKVIATAHKGTHQSGIMFLQTTKHAHKQRMKCFCAGLHPKRCMCECKDKWWDRLCMKQNTGV